jgi:hypothetical protein
MSADISQGRIVPVMLKKNIGKLLRNRDAAQRA